MSAARRTARAAGLTLIELLLGLALTALLLVAVNAMLQVSTAAGAVAARQLDLQEQAQFALRRIATAIERTPASALSAKSDDATSGDWLAPVLFDLRPGAAAGTQALCETSGGTTRVLAEPAAGFAVTSVASLEGRTVVTVALTLAKNGEAAAAQVSARLGGAL